MSAIVENIARVRERIERAAKRAGRAPEQIRLVAVSKTVEAERVLEAVNAGVKILGENYVQEAQKKISLVGHGASWHFIGHLQTNKAKLAVRLFDSIHTVDRLNLAEELNRLARQQGKVMPVLIEVHLSEEATKFGAEEQEIKPLAEKLSEMEGLAVQGLMTMPPYFENPEDSRPYFLRLRKLAEELARRRIPGLSMEELSMGMSNDFEVAIEEGATWVRVGTAIFGSRPAK
ncbi:MAG: YggS family pyridoxal phosphate-dependent enzyme [Deltaproteobacteria bacterium]|nr:YggS family pyridoxal phosphate-dependent enzyme [Deltaproteobacteria bacterium]